MALRDSTARTRELGAELRRVREQARFTGHELAKKLGWSPSKVSRMETGDRNTSEVDAAIYLAFCGVGGEELNRLLDLARESDDGYRLLHRGERLSDELRSLIVGETTAQIIVKYDPLVIPGLLQTENYARTLFDEAGLVPKDGIEPRVRARMERQQLLRRQRPPKVTFFISEEVLRKPLGGKAVIHEQLLHLLLVSAAPPSLLRVLPASVGCLAGIGPFTWMAHREHNPVIYVEELTTSLFLESRDDMLAYRRLLDRLTALALDEGQSRAFIASLASEYEREEGGV